MSVKWHFFGISIVLMINDAECILLSLMAISISSFINVYSSFCIFLNWVACFIINLHEVLKMYSGYSLLFFFTTLGGLQDLSSQIKN